MNNVEGQRLETPLLRCHGVVGSSETDTRAGLGPVKVGTVGKMKGRGGGDSVGRAGRGLGEIIGSKGCGGRCSEGRVRGVKEEVGGEGAQTAEVVNGEGYEGDVLGVEGRDDVIALGRLGGASMQFRADAGQVSPCDQKE
jgi:hypothetical protein